MVEISLTAIRAFAIEAMNLQQSGAQEDVLRHLLSNRLPLMFPENPWWIREHSIGAEANVHFVDAEGLLRNGFVDSLVGLTAIEYERNLSSDSVYAMGYSQLKEYCAALLNRGIEYGDIIGILSDTVRWHAFRVQVTQAPPSVREYGPNNIELHEIDYVSLEHHNDDSFIRFGRFINHYLGRVGSRELDAMTLARDMGFDSVFCEQNIVSFLRIVDDAFNERPEYGNMIASLWQSFVSHLENDGGQPFNRTVYANELYIITLGKLLCANILNGSVVRDEGTNLECILNGEWFRARGFVNLVEYDYFGWLNEPPYIDRILVVARRMQHDLGAYNYHVIEREDVFGPLVAQLANRDRRLLLGQEYTPQWLAQRMVARSMELLPEEDFPNFVDMCCGSGVFVVETINQTISRYGINPGNCSPAQLGQLMSCIVGFDIDPLAVLLAKLNWAMAMREFVPHAVSDLVIPIYHADSLFTVAPITTSIDGDYEEQDLQMNFDGEHVGLPGFLMNPSNRRLFDTLVHVCYETAKARVRNGTEEACSRAQVGELVETVGGDVGIHLGEEQRVAVVTSCQALIATLERLQRDNRNGIWPFLLGNGYRPALVRNQFNAIVSNPPWMAMSKLHDNPYRSVLVSRAERYGIKPDGSSHLHTELATVFFLNSVDKFLQQDGIASILMPDTLLNGYHHEPFRNQRYADADWPVNLTLSEIWEVHVDTFKNKSIAVFARKMDGVNSNPLPGRRVHENLPDEPCQFRLLRRSRRSAWSSNPAAQDITDVILDEIPFRQGADITDFPHP